MKRFAIPLFCLLLGSPAALAEAKPPAAQVQKAIPLDNFQLNMSFGGSKATTKPYTYISMSGQLEAGSEKPEFEVSYLCGNVTNVKDGQSTSHFPLSEPDIGTLIRVSAAAQNESAMKIDVDYDNVGWKTSYESIQVNGAWKVVMTRNEWVAEFDPSEGEQLGNLLEECMSTIAWYEKLFSAKELPEPSPGARPSSHIDHMTMTASFGEVSIGDFGYRSDFSYGSTERLPSNTHHKLAVHYIHQSDQKYQGKWVRDLMVKTSEASEAAQNLEGYFFRARNKEMTYEIASMPDMKQAQVRLHSDLGRNSFMAPTAKIDPKKAQEVAAVVNRAEAFERWFAEHHTLLAANRP